MQRLSLRRRHSPSETLRRSIHDAPWAGFCAHPALLLSPPKRKTPQQLRSRRATAAAAGSCRIRPEASAHTVTPRCHEAHSASARRRGRRGRRTRCPSSSRSSGAQAVLRRRRRRRTARRSVRPRVCDPDGSPFRSGPLRTIDDSNGSPPGGSIGTTPDDCTPPSTTSRPTSSRLGTTLATKRRPTRWWHPQRSAKEPGTVHPGEDRAQGDAGSIDDRELVESGGDASPLLGEGEEPLDHVPTPVGVRVESEGPVA